MSIYAERLARVEERVKILDAKITRIEDKIDTLITLRDKGAGIFGFIAMPLGLVFVGICAEIIRYFVGKY